MSHNPDKKGRGRGGRRDYRQSQPGSPSSGASTPSSASGKGKGRGRPGHVETPTPPGSREGAAMASALPAVEQLSIQEPGATASATIARADTKSEPMSQPKEETDLKQLMKRPGIGREGRPIKLFANHFPVRIPDGMRVFHYDFAVARRFKRKKGSGPSTKSKPAYRRRDNDDDDDAASVEEIIGDDGNFEIVLRRCRKWPKWLVLAIYQNLVTNPAFGLVAFRHKMAFDGAKNVFAQCPLPVPTGDAYEMELQIPDEDRKDNFVVTLNRVAEVNIDLHEVFNRSLIDRRSTSTLVLDVILHQSKMFSNVFISMRSRAFYHPANPANLGGGLWHYPGIWESIRPVSGWKSTINLDLANSAFVQSGPLLQFIHQMARTPWQNRSLQPWEIKELEKLVKGLKVDLIHRHGKRSVRCVGITRESARQLTFECAVADGGTRPLSVEKYFQMMRQKGEFVRDVQYPLLPCLHVGNKNKKNYVPIEFCEVKAGQRYNHKLNDFQTSAMLKVASQSAPERKAKIEEEARHFNFHQDPYLKSFGLTVDMKMMELSGRVLAAPAIEYGKQATIMPKDGGWNLRDVRVIKGATIRKWAVINTDSKVSGPNMENFCKRLIAEATHLGITFTVNQPVGVVNEGNADNIEKIMKNLKERAVDPGTKSSTLDLVFVILAAKNTPFYSSTKSAGDVVLGVNTQCILGKNVYDAKVPLLVNLLLKINAKMGGVNNKLVDGSKQKIRQLHEPILIIGADVNHPAPTDGEAAPSVAAVVANVDCLPAQYAAKIMVQPRRQEPIAELERAVSEMIYNFRKRNGHLPMRIIMYRDGVGESMFLKVLTDELHSIRRACEAMGKYFKVAKYEPPITFIVVQKRHHTRLFCANQRDEAGRGRNIPPGTTVDTEIVHPEEFDFYLCSHLGLQGTSRPTHYHVLWDDSNFTADELQTLTYYLCYTYARAMKSVSIPPPVYYADLVAYRARQYLAWSWQNISESGSTVSGASTVSISELQKYVAVNENVAEKGMYFV